MTKEALYYKIKRIPPIHQEVAVDTKDYLQNLAKPPGSLGELEYIAQKISAITGKQRNHLDKRCVLVFSADNGVVKEGVASGPQSITAAQTRNMLDGMTGVSVIAKHFHSDLMVIDVGIHDYVEHKDLIRRSIRRGTSNIAKQEAMSLNEVIQAVEIGIEMAEKAWKRGYQVIGIGEMGIGNTTTSSAVLAALLGLSIEEVRDVVGKGAGLTKSAYQKKIAVIETALLLNRPQKDDPIDCLQKVGGFDLAAMTGAYLGAALFQLPVAIDGFISIVAALCAARLNPLVKDYLFASHCSHERGYVMAQNELGLNAVLHLDMRLGEGSGCPIMFEIMETACMVVRDMATFEKAQINTDYLNPIRNQDAF
ncbi:MAG: nicotinate-nucleotide--dimethylbenzimidazole phosphoribosyltransferase [Velocimicrobium sp.]